MNKCNVCNITRGAKLHLLSTVLISSIGMCTVVKGAAEDDANNDEKDKIQVHEIIVTAQKRPENMQDVPISMTAFSEEFLEDTGAVRFENVTDFIPNVNFNTNSSIRATQITVRGITSDANSVGVDQAVGVYVDGIYMGRPTTINTGIYDIDRIEVLRGPQGTLWGKNVIAGAINFITRRPTDEFEGDITLNIGNFDSTLIAGTVSGPLIDDKLLLRISAQTEQRDGYLENLAGPDNNDANNTNGRLSLMYLPTDNLNILVSADIAKDRTNQGAGELAIISPIYSAEPFNVVPGHEFYLPNDAFDYKIADAESSHQDRDVKGASVEVNWSVDGGIFTSITAYREFTWDNFQTSDLGPFDIFGTGIIEDQDQFSQEIRYSSGLGDRFEYVIGAYYFEMRLDAEPTATVGVDALSVPAFGGAPLGSFPGPSISKLLPKIDNESYAVFGQGHYQVTDKLIVTAGLRYTKEKKAINFSVLPDFVIVNPIDPAVKIASINKDVISPMFSLSYELGEEVNTYFTYAEGFKAGGFNAFDFDFSNDDGSVPEFKPEFVNSYEIGMKSMLFDRKIRLNTSIFYIDYTDLQVNQRLEGENGLFFFRTTNAGKAESSGFEIDATAKLSDGFDVTMTYGYVNSEYKDFVIDELNGVDYTGNTLVLAPKNTFSLTAQYVTLLVGDWDILVRAETSYRSSSFSDQDNTAELKNGSRNLTNLRIGFENNNSGIKIIAWTRNIFSEKYTHGKSFGSSTFSPGALQFSVGDPRTYGLELSYSF